MARIRMIKPEFFDDPQVGELSPLARLFFIGLWTQADSAGRLEDDMRRLKARIFPYDDIDCEPLADELHRKNMIRRYKTGQAVEKHGFLWVCNFVKHQRPHPKEPASVIPPFSDTAVEKHGEPWKNGTNLPESGSCFLDTESGIRNLESGTRKLEIKAVPSAPPAHQPVENIEKNIRIITKIAHEAIEARNGHSDVDVIEQIKTLCAKRHIRYDSEVVRKALDSAEAQRR